VRWPLGERLEVLAAPEERAALAQAASKGPVLFSIRSPGQLELHGGSRQWRLARREQEQYELTRSASGQVDSRSLLTRWLATPPAGSHQGICATRIEWSERS
jgi:hypothetical protein